MTTEIENWKKECESFEKWFKGCGGNIGNPIQMSEAFRRIEAKNVSDSKLYQLLDNPDGIVLLGSNDLKAIESKKV